MTNEECEAYLHQAGVPVELHQEAMASFAQAKKKYWRDVLPFKLTAPFMAPFIAWKMKWEDDEFPEWAKPWANHLGPHGARTDWVTSDYGYLERGPAPLSEEVRLNSKGELLNYYAGEGHVRSWFARTLWLIKTAGAGRANQVGAQILGHYKYDADKKEYSFNIKAWGTFVHSFDRYKIDVYRIGKQWQMVKKYNWETFSVFDTKYTIGFLSNWGYNIQALVSEFDARDVGARLSVTYTTVPFISAEKTDTPFFNFNVL